MSIEKLIEEEAAANGYGLTKFYTKIAKAKERFFGEKDWRRCPCDPESDRACISARCRREIEENGFCHCNCYCKKDDNEVA